MKIRGQTMRWAAMGVAVVLSAGLAQAQSTISWAAGVNGDWQDDARWSSGVAPTAADNVRFSNGGATYTVTLTDDVDITYMRSFPGANGIDVTFDLNGYDLTANDGSNQNYMQGNAGGAESKWTFSNTSTTDGTVTLWRPNIMFANRSAKHTIVVTGAHTTLLGVGTGLDDSFVVGRGNTGGEEARLEILDGATVHSVLQNLTSRMAIRLGRNDSTVTPVVLVDGAGSTLTVDKLEYRRGDISVSVTNGGRILANEIATSSVTLNGASLTVSGADSLVDVAGLLQPRLAGWEVTVSDGGQLKADRIQLFGEADNTHVVHVHGHASVGGDVESAIVTDEDGDNNDFRVLSGAVTRTLRFTLTDPDITTALIKTGTMDVQTGFFELDILADPAFKAGWQENDTFKLIEFSTWSGQFFGNVTDGEEFTTSQGDVFRIDRNTNDLTLTYIPEPGSVMLLGLGGLLLALRRRCA